MRRIPLKLGLAIVSSVASLSITVTASAASPTVVRLATADAAVRWDLTTSWIPVTNLQRLLCDGLYDLPSSGTVPVPAVAADDGVWGPTSVTFPIRPGLRFRPAPS